MSRPGGRLGMRLRTQRGAIFSRWHAHMIFEDVIEARDRTEACRKRNFRDPSGWIRKEFLGLFHPDARDIFRERHASRLLEELAEIEAAYMDVLNDLAERDRFLDMSADEFLGVGHRLRVGIRRGDRLSA